MMLHPHKKRITLNLKPCFAMYKFLSFLVLLTATISSTQGQEKLVEMGETMEDYIEKNHVENIENMVHHFTSSNTFLEKLLEEGHHIAPGSARVKRKDVDVGKDIDIYVKHLSEHQNFTMFLIPINFKTHNITDTLLISVLEVSDSWLKKRHYYSDIENDSVKSHLLSSHNHNLVAEHMFHQAIENDRFDVAEVTIKLHESYMSNNTVKVDYGKLTSEEKKEIKETWTATKRLLSHNAEMNAEMNVYVFGLDAMELDVIQNGVQNNYVITPSNIFTRHHFEEK